MEIIGKIEKIFESQQITDSFTKRNMVLTTNEMYPQKILIEFIQEKVMLLNNFNEGDDVKVAINIRGREWTNPQGELKYFNSIVGWRIEPYITGQNNVQQQSMNNVVHEASTDDSSTDDEVDDLPF